jgi:hypothetical protein
MRRPGNLTSLIFISVALAAGFDGSSASAAATSALEPRDGRPECDGVPACKTVSTATQSLRMGQPTQLSLACPAGTYFWNWSATVARFVEVTLLNTKANKAKHEIGATFEYYAQSGNGPGQAKVYLGCSAKPISAGKLKIRRLGHGWNPHQ